MDIRYYRCNLTKGQHLALYILCAAAMMGVLFLFYHSFIVALPGGLLLGFLPEKMLADRSISRRKNALRLQFKDFLESMSVAVRAGNTELNAIRSALQDLRLSYNENTDIVREVAYIVDAHEKRGLALSELFMDLGMRSDIEDIRSFAEIFQATSGKSDRFRDIVQETQDIISQKIEIQQEIETTIAGAKSETVMMLVLPILLVAMMSVMGGGMLDALFTTSSGRIAATVALALFIGAYILSVKFTDVEV